MVQRREFEMKVSCPACQEPVALRTGIVDLGSRLALLCPHCGELSFARPRKPPVPRH
jgi:hypothetical protein